MSGGYAEAGPLAGYRITASRPARKGPVGGAYRGPRQARRAVLSARRRRMRAHGAVWGGLVVFVMSLLVLVVVLG